MLLDRQEPENVADSIKLMGLKHTVVTSVDRDDLPDLGAQHWVNTIVAIREKNPATTIEVLVPDFQGREALIDEVCAVRPNIMAHNMETVRRLTPTIRSAAKYGVSLKTIAQIAKNNVF